jgi:hypothetical protein
MTNSVETYNLLRRGFTDDEVDRAKQELVQFISTCTGRKTPSQLDSLLGDHVYHMDAYDNRFRHSVYGVALSEMVRDKQVTWGCNSDGYVQYWLPENKDVVHLPVYGASV